jgi:hypothetical protein
MNIFDLIVAGMYDPEYPRTQNDSPLLATRNQELIFPTGRISLTDLKDIPEVEFYLNDEGDLVRTGIGVPGV